MCAVCNGDGSKGRLAICDECDEGYHLGCLEPALKAFPSRAFKCPKCMKCASCGADGNKSWTRDYTMCEPCGRQFKRRQYCPICLKGYGPSETNMVECDKCKFWVHAHCDGIEDVSALGESGGMYTCPNCRGERTMTLMLQVLDQLSREDRGRFFAEPVSVEYALATQYHAVVDTPMDFATMRTKVSLARIFPICQPPFLLFVTRHYLV